MFTPAGAKKELKFVVYKIMGTESRECLELGNLLHSPPGDVMETSRDSCLHKSSSALTSLFLLLYFLSALFNTVLFVQQLRLVGIINLTYVFIQLLLYTSTDQRLSRNS